MRTFFRRKRYLKWHHTLAVLCLGALLILCFGTALQYGSVIATLKNFLRHPTLLFLNLFPIAVVLAVLYALFGNAFYAVSLTSALFHTLSLINLIKIECRDDPLVPDDIFLLREAMQATGEYRLNLHVPYILCIVLLAVALFLVGIKLKSARPKAPWRVAIALLPIGGFLWSMATVYRDVDLYNDLVHSIDYIYEYNIPEVFDALGFNYCFLRNFRLYNVERPDGYSKAEAEAWASSDGTPDADHPRPNVLFVQCEAFSDIMADDVFTYAEQDNPLYAYRLVADSDRALSGHIVVANYGAGTANTEFDVITGMQTIQLASVPTSAFRVIHRNTNSLARVFSADGYETYFMHPGQRWFYNRESVYNHFGIRDTVFSGAFTNADFKGNMVSDEAFLRRLIQDFEARTEADAPLFAFTVTIQNHQSYPYSKYSGMDIAPAQLAVPVSDEAMEQLSVYAEGIRDSSEMLYALTQYLDTVDEPTVVVFWGDHLPALGNNFSVYRELGLDIGEDETPEGTLNTYKTPFVIWANRAYCAENDFAQAVSALELPDEPLISDIYLGDLVYELLGMRGQDAYFDYLCQARRALPVFYQTCCYLPDGTYTTSPPDDLTAIIDKLHKWEYYRLIDEPVR